MALEDSGTREFIPSVPFPSNPILSLSPLPHPLPVSSLCVFSTLSTSLFSTLSTTFSHLHLYSSFLHFPSRSFLLTPSLSFRSYHCDPLPPDLDPPLSPALAESFDPLRPSLFRLNTAICSTWNPDQLQARNENREIGGSTPSSVRRIWRLSTSMEALENWWIVTVVSCRLPRSTFHESCWFPRRRAVLQKCNAETHLRSKIEVFWRDVEVAKVFR